MNDHPAWTILPSLSKKKATSLSEKQPWSKACVSLTYLYFVFWLLSRLHHFRPQSPHPSFISTLSLSLFSHSFPSFFSFSFSLISFFLQGMRSIKNRAWTVSAVTEAVLVGSYGFLWASYSLSWTSPQEFWKGREGWLGGVSAPQGSSTSSSWVSNLDFTSGSQSSYEPMHVIPFFFPQRKPELAYLPYVLASWKNWSR